MTARSYLRGHPIISAGEHWVFEDTGEPTEETWKARPCGHCGRHDTPEGHDACLGTLPGVMNACCGHGMEREAYVQFLDGTDIRGRSAVIILAELVKHRIA